MSGTEIVLECEFPDCDTTFATGRSLWKDAEIEGREAGWNLDEGLTRCPEHKDEGATPKFSEFDRNHLVEKLQSLHSIIQTGLNAHNGDGEWSALVDAGIELGLEYNEEEDKYE